MIRAIVLELISVGTLAEEGPLLQPRRAQTAAAGLPTCLCLTKLPLEEKSCTYDFAPEGLCFQVVGLAQNFTLVPASFGESCAIHYDPHQACSDLTKYPPEVKPISQQARYRSIARSKNQSVFDRSIHQANNRLIIGSIVRALH